MWNEFAVSLIFSRNSGYHLIKDLIICSEKIDVETVHHSPGGNVYERSTQ